MLMKLVKTIIILAIIAGVGFYLITGESNTAPGKTETTKLNALKSYRAEKRDLIMKVVQSGELKALRSLVFGSEIRSNQAKIIYIIKEGTFVSKDDVLFRFDKTPFNDRIDDLNSRKAEADANLIRANEDLEYSNTKFKEELNSAEQKIRMAELRLKNVTEGEGVLKLERAKSKIKAVALKVDAAKIALENAKKMLDKGFVTKTEVDKAEIALKQTEEEYYFASKENELLVSHTYPIELEDAENSVSHTRDFIDKLKQKHLHEVNGFGANIQHAKNRVKRMERRIKAAEKELTKTEVRAPIPGFAVYSKSYFGGKMRSVQLGDAIWSNQDVMMIPDTSKMLVDSRIREADIFKVKVGQDVDVKVDAYPDLDLKGKVSRIGALAQSKNPLKEGMPKSFDMEVEILNNDERLRPGMSARVEIISEVIKNALTLPVQTFFTENNVSYCYVRDGADYKKVKIIPGRSNEDYIEIVSGITPGENVFDPEEVSRIKTKETKRGFSLINALSDIFTGM